MRCPSPAKPLVPKCILPFENRQLPNGRQCACGNIGCLEAYCGHKGIKSIQQYIGNKKIKQILIGVGMIPDDMDKTEYLLSNFNEEEEKVLSEVYKFVFKAIFCLFNYSIDLVREKFNHVMKTLDYEKYTRKFQAR